MAVFFLAREREMVQLVQKSTPSGTSSDSWHPVMSTDTTTPSYWLTWRILLCATWILICTTFSLVIIWKYEGARELKPGDCETQQETAGSLYEDDTWRPCLKGVHPAWLLAFRFFGFVVLLSMLIVITIVDGGSIFYYYTQWTFTLITIYFGLGTLFSISGCHQYQKTATGDKVDIVETDAEQGQDTVAAPAQASRNGGKNSLHPQVWLDHKPAGIWGYVFQIIFQVNAGGVLLTDSVFWFIIVPFLTVKDYKLNGLTINMHTINAVFLFGDAALNSLHFAGFRVAYMFLWTVVYVLFQWIVHANINLWWPYPFLDLSSSYAPLWYLSVALLHIPCYGFFTLAIKLKRRLLSTWFPESYRCSTR